LFSSEQWVATKKLAKMMVIFGKIYSIEGNTRSVYMQGTTFTLGGIMRLEAKSYLKTKFKYKQNSTVFPCPVEDP
jgi:hypothetical protein